jgi:hypothetical protein
MQLHEYVHMIRRTANLYDLYPLFFCRLLEVGE